MAKKKSAKNPVPVSAAKGGGFPGVGIMVPVLLAIAAGSVYMREPRETLLGFLGLGDSVIQSTSVAVEESLRSFVGNPNVSVVDHAVSGLPKVRLGHRVVDLFSGWHFDDILMDAPDAIRPASLVAFYNSQDSECMAKYKALNLDTIAETEMPARSQLFIARYDMYSAPKRPWYEFTPEMDLEKRFNVESCPEVVFASRTCDGFTEWCSRGKDEEDPSLEVFGCDDFGESCPSTKRSIYDGKTGLKEWVSARMEEDGYPQLTKFLGTFTEQGAWLQKREYTTCGTHLRNSYLAQAFPAFTHRGFKVMDTPKEVQDWLLEFHKDYEKYRKTEQWHAESTQLSFHEKPTTFIDMDRVRAKKNKMAIQYLQPLVEEWSGMKPLELTSFYGMREYHSGAWLRQHVDRIDTHVLSVTISVDKRNETADAKPWPLRVTDWTGKQVAYDHPAGTMILYESSKLPHGRPTRNQGGIHLGAFVHFKPLNMHGSEAKEWDAVAQRARKNQQIHTQHATYRCTEEFEPESPVYAEENIGEGSVWKGKGKAKNDAGLLAVEFRNRADRPLDVYWYHSSQPKPVLQGRAHTASSLSINSYHGHQFFFAEVDTETALPGGKVTIDKGKAVYTYNRGKDGNVVQV